MPRFEVELDDKMEFVGTLPPELDQVLQTIRNTANADGHGKGYQKAVSEAKAQIADAVKAEKARLEQLAPLERQKWQDIDDTNKALTTQLQALSEESRKQLKAATDAHAVDVTKRMEAINARDAKIRGLVMKNVLAIAGTLGAREESMSELPDIFAKRIGFNDEMEPYVIGEDGNPATTTAGNPLGIDVFVKTYLDSHRHHLKPVNTGRGGDARGGASKHGTPPTADAARSRVDTGDRSLDAINELYEATRRRSA